MKAGYLKICRSRTGAALIAAVIALFAAQILVAAHTAKYGDDPHEHDGQVCAFFLAAHGGEKAIHSAAFVLAGIVAIWRAGAQVVQTERAAVAVRSAKSRGPPNF